jgi:ATP-dependent Clp protease ATP-binding subunit ClpX
VKSRSAKADLARCTFCHKSEDVVERLVRSPRDADVRICDECLSVCNSILADEVDPPEPLTQPDELRHLRLCDPRIPELLDTLERWVVAESQHRQSLAFLGRACRLALAIMDSR